MNGLLLALGIEGWKPTLTALVLPPVPLLLLVLAGAWLLTRRRVLGSLLLALGCAGLWLMGTEAAAMAIERSVLKPPPALSASAIAALRRAPKTAIVVLGGGRVMLALEYGVSSLKPRSIDRLRYGIHLGRETGLPVVFSGGVGYGAQPGLSEAEIAARIAEREFGFKLRWLETESRDTRENALRSVALLRQQGIEHIVLVTQAYHMPRALKHFENAAAAAGPALRLTPAPMDKTPDGHLQVTDWLPSLQGYENTRLNLHEWLGWLLGA